MELSNKNVGLNKTEKVVFTEPAREYPKVCVNLQTDVR